MANIKFTFRFSLAFTFAYRKKKLQNFEKNKNVCNLSPLWQPKRNWKKNLFVEWFWDFGCL